jgi:hypothetical protein
MLRREILSECHVLCPISDKSTRPRADQSGVDREGAAGLSAYVARGEARSAYKRGAQLAVFTAASTG